ncbi:MAG: hypothetical protein AABX38_02000 [Candidatus Micrarchaeota archaeon]
MAEDKEKKDLKKEKSENKPFIEFVGDFKGNFASKSKAKNSMTDILAKLENAKAQAKKRQELGF